MQSLGVIDLRHGSAVHAMAGDRARYVPVTRVGGRPIPPGDAGALATAYVEDLGVDGLYVADLDAILGEEPALDRLPTLAAHGVPLWYDGAIVSAPQALRARALGVAHPIVALETLPSFSALDAICDAAEGVAFGLDLRDGVPVTRPDAVVEERDVVTLVARALRAGARAVVVIDLARVGTGNGPDDGLVARVRQAAPDATIASGGGVRHASDLVRLRVAGCDAVLLATALHDGRLTREDLASARLATTARPPRTPAARCPA